MGSEGGREGSDGEARMSFLVHLTSTRLFFADREGMLAKLVGKGAHL